MSYFMTVSGRIPNSEVVAGVELVPAANAQRYISSLEGELAEEDGAPVFLVHDGETGTSDLLIGDLQEAISDSGSATELAAYQMIQLCFAKSVPFRIWLARDSADDHKRHPVDVQCIGDVCQALISGRGAKWSAL
ncbi:hypothetical protein [Uliginosibacterium sp. TH139]|uniref:hypothetical protein n=1 Tax=Uliginosibacterium sp. TH139 TaxID=2067453 RepID=UPI001180762A|nr:hypothetical protein [Uliginosibacterium sp. TH139]